MVLFELVFFKILIVLLGFVENEIFDKMGVFGLFEKWKDMWLNVI